MYASEKTFVLFICVCPPSQRRTRFLSGIRLYEKRIICHDQLFSKNTDYDKIFVFLN